VANFVARDEEMDVLRHNLLPKPTHETRRKVFVLHGLGGSGKTQLAIEFAQVSQRIFSSIFWVDCNDRESVRQAFIEIARKLPKDQIPESCRPISKLSSEELDEIIRNVLAWFDQYQNDRWLLIFDNVDRDCSLEASEPQSFDVEEFFPESNHGSILVTTRLRQLRQLGEDGKLERMTNQQGVEVLQRRIGRSMDGRKFLTIT
jgi:hypothetical protein